MLELRPFRRLHAPIVALAVGLTLPAIAQNQASGNQRPQARGTSTNLFDFRPEAPVGILPAESINLPAVFEALGQDATDWYQHVLTLSNPFFEGRAPTTAGDSLTARYLEFFFEQYGLEPAFDGMTGSTASMSYRQPLEFNNPSPKINVVESVLEFDGRTLEHGTDFVVMGNAGNASVSAPVSFVGYAVEAGPDGYSSFDDTTDLEGRIAIMLRYEPLDADGKSQWRPEDRAFGRQSEIRRKMRSLFRRDVAGVIMVNPPGAAEGATGLESTGRAGRTRRQADVPVIQISHDVADALLRKADPQGRDLMAWRKLADAGSVAAVNLRDGVRVTMATELEIDAAPLATHNVGAVLPGKGDLADKWIVIGAHYDHVGYGYTGARRPSAVGELHPGADDNGSGTAGMLIMARRLAERYRAAGDDANLRSVLFLGFAGEEAGLHGSRHFVRNPTMPAQDISVMLNMDMIGRLRSNSVSIGGTGTAEEFKEILPAAYERSGLIINESPGGRGASDHSNFYGAGIPVLFAFTGLHDRYHTPDDIGSTVNPAGAIRIVDLLEDLAWTFVTSEDQMTYVAIAGNETRGRRMGSRVRLGIMPGYEDVEVGVYIEDVYDGTSAADGGIRAGDILVGWNGEEITDGTVLMNSLRQSSPGDVVKIKVLRDGKALELDVTLKARGE